MANREGLKEPFVMLSDPKGVAGKLYAGMAQPNLHTPATYVIGKDGKIAYRYVGENIRVRAAAEAVLKAVKASWPCSPRAGTGPS